MTLFSQLGAEKELPGGLNSDSWTRSSLTFSKKARRTVRNSSSSNLLSQIALTCERGGFSFVFRALGQVASYDSWIFSLLAVNSSRLSKLTYMFHLRFSEASGMWFFILSSDCSVWVMRSSRFSASSVVTDALWWRKAWWVTCSLRLESVLSVSIEPSVNVGLLFRWYWGHWFAKKANQAAYTRFINLG